MTAPRFTPDGIQVQTFQEIYDELAAGYRAIYGEDINLDADSPDGQRVAIEAQLVLDAQSFGALEYNQRDPDFALGQSLNSIIKLSGITRRPATRSQVDVTVVTDRPLTLPVDYAVEDDLGQGWTTLAVRTLSAGATTVTLFSENFGAVEADPATVTQPVTVVIGVQSVTNPTAATVGIDEETDQELRVRRNRSLETPQSSSTGRMFTALANLPNVTDVAVYENDTDTTDSDGIPAHSLWVVVEGGAVADIIETMTKNKTGGKGMVGAVTGTFSEPVTRPNGTTFTIVHSMTFDRPVDVPVLVRLDATFVDVSLPIDDERIRQEIATKQFGTGDSLKASSLYVLAFNSGENFIPTNLEISRDAGASWTGGQLIADLNEKFSIASADVTVTEVIP
jgi:uncharacterized phage protein gp47/JayE